MTEFYEIKREDGAVILPRKALKIAVATEGNIHFSFKTDMKQSIPQPQGQPPVEQEIIERVDFKVSGNAENILYEIMIAPFKIIDLVKEVTDRDSEAKLRYTNPPMLTLESGVKGGNSLTLPLEFVTNITDGKNEVSGVTEITITLQQNQKVVLTCGEKFKGFNKFVSELQEATTERLVRTIDLSKYGITAFRTI